VDIGSWHFALQAFRPQGCETPELAVAAVQIAPALVPEMARRFPQLVLRSE
jgi:hypothetical protein